MLRTLGIVAAATLAISASPLGAESRTYLLQLNVPVVCQVRFQPAAAVPVDGGALPLGEINEYCNAPGGYELVISYAPGALQGAVISAGDDQVVLNGSGHAVLSRAPGPRIRARMLSASPGAQGFDTDRLDLRLQPIA